VSLPISAVPLRGITFGDSIEEFSTQSISWRPACYTWAKRMQYFVRTMEKHKDSMRVFSIELPCSGLNDAKEEAKRMVLQSNPALMLQADACFRNRNQVRTKYRCWINERGEFQERALV